MHPTGVPAIRGLDGGAAPSETLKDRAFGEEECPVGGKILRKRGEAGVRNRRGRRVETC